MTDTIIELDKVSFGYYPKNPVLENVSFKIKKGDFFGIIGPNGGGKTTLVKIILGLLKQNKGIIKIFGKEPEKVSRLIGYVPQEKESDKGFPVSVKNVVMMGRLPAKRLFSFYSKDDTKIVEEALEFVEMKHLINRQMRELSGGQKQRIYIARAIASRSKIIIFDEPSTGIDPKFHHELYGLISRINEQMTVIAVSHDLECLSGRVSTIAYVNRSVNIKTGEEIAGKNFFDLYHTL